MVNSEDVPPGRDPGGTSSLPSRAPAIDSEPQPPFTLGPYTVEYLGQRMGLRVLRIRAGRHTLDISATLDGIAARVTAELDGWRLMRRPKKRPWRRWSNVLEVQRWVLAAAAEAHNGTPRWTCDQIAKNIKRARRAEMSSGAVRRLIWKLSPTLAERRARYWRVEQWKTPRKRKRRSAAAGAGEREAVIAEMRRAGLI